MAYAWMATETREQRRINVAPDLDCGCASMQPVTKVNLIRLVSVSRAVMLGEHGEGWFRRVLRTGTKAAGPLRRWLQISGLLYDSGIWRVSGLEEHGSLRS